LPLALIESRYPYLSTLTGSNVQRFEPVLNLRLGLEDINVVNDSHRVIMALRSTCNEAPLDEASALLQRVAANAVTLPQPEPSLLDGLYLAVTTLRTRFSFEFKLAEVLLPAWLAATDVPIRQDDVLQILRVHPAALQSGSLVRIVMLMLQDALGMSAHEVRPCSAYNGGANAVFM
jgi:hypothetical protein